MAETVIVCLLHLAQEGYFLLALDDKPIVRGFNSEADGLEFFEGAYQRAFARGYTGPSSAMLTAIQVQPSIVTFRSMNALRVVVGEQVRFCSIRGESFYASGVRCLNQKRAAIVHARGKVPRLTAY